MLNKKTQDVPNAPNASSNINSPSELVKDCAIFALSVQVHVLPNYTTARLKTFRVGFCQLRGEYVSDSENLSP